MTRIVPTKLLPSGARMPVLGLGVYKSKKTPDVGRAVRDSGLSRNDVFLTTKLWVSEWGYDKATTAIRQCNELEGIVRDIGVSNFGQAHLEKLFETARMRPAVNQVELHLWLTRASLVAFCRDHSILVESYSPLAKAAKFGDPTVQAIARDVGATEAQVLLAYSLAKDYITIPKTISAERQRENLEAPDVSLSSAQAATLDALDENFIVAWDPMTTHGV